MTIENVTETRSAPNWRHVGAFLGLTFGLTYLLDLVIYLRGGLNTPGIVAVLQLQMLLPAFSAIVLGLFFFPGKSYLSQSSGRAGTLVLLLLPAVDGDLCLGPSVC